MNRTEKILVVEDDRNIAMSLEKTFSREGYPVKVSRDVKSARAQIESFDPDLIVLDWMLPDGDGLDLLRWLRARRCRL